MKVGIENKRKREGREQPTGLFPWILFGLCKSYIKRKRESEIQVKMGREKERENASTNYSELMQIPSINSFGRKNAQLFCIVHRIGKTLNIKIKIIFSLHILKVDKSYSIEHVQYIHRKLGIIPSTKSIVLYAIIEY